jgi:sterol desaturase/sphingolipid hydroxylase (fatty acid hydroxylase superfamily)
MAPFRDGANRGFGKKLAPETRRSAARTRSRPVDRPSCMSSMPQEVVLTIAYILAAMAAIGAVEFAIPLHARRRDHAAHVKPNLALTFTTFATYAVLNTLAAIMLLWLRSKGWGLLNTVTVAPVVAVASVVLALDFAFYAVHVAMHKVPAFWRFHRVHHSDRALDVTSTIRQHPGESVIRYVAIAAAAAAMGASPATFAVYRLASALNALLEHANIKLPAWIDNSASWVTTWANFHKVHHSRIPAETDSNFGNLFSWWDRLFGTCTPASRGATVLVGLEGFDHPDQQTTAGLLVMPFVEGDRIHADAPA